MRFSLPLLLVFLSAGCTQTTIVADEYLNADSTDPATEPIDTATETLAETDSDPVTDTDTGEPCPLPLSFQWTSTGPLISPPEGMTAIKDPTVVFHDGTWHVYATVRDMGLNMAWLGVSDFTDAVGMEPVPLSQNPNMTGYKAAPQLFYFSPQQLWYLVYQTPEPAWSTSTNPGDVSSWSPMTTFMTLPELDGEDGVNGIDYWIICDETDCYLFFSALNGLLYRARTPKEQFPNGFAGTIEVVMQDERFNLYDASNVYRISGTDTWLLLVSAIGGTGRYFRAWTATRLDGDWTPLADTPENAFASVHNVTGADWSAGGISHGEMLRTNPDETMTIDACRMQYLYSGIVHYDETTETDFYQLGLLTLSP